MKRSHPLQGEDETLDTFYHGRILVLQKKKGYRFSVDAPLLADFIPTRPSDELLELGAGCGIISLLLSIKPFGHITAVEIQGSLADLARRNVRINHLEERITVVQEDLRRFDPPKKFDVVFSNPPYIKKGKGNLSVSEEKSVARHEIRCDIFDVIRKASQLLKSTGSAYFVFPARREKDIFQAMEKNGLKLSALRRVHSRPGGPPSLLLVGSDFRMARENVMPPFIIYDKSGRYTSEAEEIFRGRVRAAE